MKPFDLERAKAGDPVCTRDGRHVQIICFDAKGYIRTILALVEHDSTEILESYSPDGRYQDHTLQGHPNDLMMAGKKIKIWVDIYSDGSAFWYGTPVPYCPIPSRITCIETEIEV